jgi:L-malate glycosyltransferase
MRIAHLVDTLGCGGAEKLVLLLCRMQSEAGHAPRIHCLLRGGALLQDAENAGVPCQVHGPAGRWVRIHRLYRALRQDAPDVVHCHNAAAAISGAPVARLAGVRRVVVTRHGMVPPPPATDLRQEVKFWAMSGCYDRVVAVCEATAGNLRRGPCADVEKISTIRNAAAPAPRNDLGSLRSASSRFSVVTVGRLVQDKDQFTLIRAFSLARRRVPDLFLSLIGSGPQEAALRRLTVQLGMDSSVEFLGERAGVGDYLAASDLFVLSSVREGLPLALLEAMAAGLPSVVTNVGGMPEVVLEAGAGSVVARSDPEELADAIVFYASQRASLKQIRRRASQWYNQYGSPRAMSSQYLHLYSEIHA